MSYSSLVNDLDPYFYFPMGVRENFIPLDIVGDLQPFVEGDYGFERQQRFFSDPINILEGSYFLLDQSSDFSSPSATYSFWLDSDLVEEFTEIFSIHDSIEGFGLSYSKEDFKFVVEFYEESTSEISFDLKDPVLITFVVSSGNLSFYVDEELVLQTSNFSIPAQPVITLGTLRGLLGRGELRISDFFYLQSDISAINVANLYSLGFDGYEIFSLDSSSTISLNDVDNKFIQTAWQAYGEITTKK